jgi:hypothetical protein
MESVTSPDKMTPPNKQNKTKRHLVDLTLDNNKELNKEDYIPQLVLAYKKTKNKG